MKGKMDQLACRTKRIVILVSYFCYVDQAVGVEFEKVGTAVAKVLGTSKAFKTSVNLRGKNVTVFYSRGRNGHPARYAVLQKGLYEPNCTHTWVVGVKPKTAVVKTIRVVEMKCPHAFPTKKAAFLKQFIGRGPASVSRLSEEVHTVARATGSSHLTTDAVKTSIEAVYRLGRK